MKIFMQRYGIRLGGGVVYRYSMGFFSVDYNCLELIWPLKAETVALKC